MANSRRTVRSDDRRVVRAQTIARFSQSAGEFERLYRTDSESGPRSAFSYARLLLDQALAGIVAGLPPRSRILDAGCGTGHLIRKLLDAGHDVVGVEPAAPMREAARRLNPDAPIVDAIISDLPFGDGRFDLVVAIEVLRYLHAADVLAALAEMTRVTRPGGRMIFTVVNRWALNSFFAYYTVRHALSQYSGIAPPPHCEFTTAHTIRRQCAAAGAGDVTMLPWVAIPLVRPLYRFHPAAGRLMARIMLPVERFLRTRRWATGVAGGLIVVARRLGATP